MKITVLCSSFSHPINEYLNAWKIEHELNHEIEIIRSRDELSSGDFLFLISCSEIISQEYRDKYSHVLVAHASDLPKGRGWSPHIWDIVNGSEDIYICLIEAEDKVDTGKVWIKRRLRIADTALWDEINQILFKEQIELITYAINNYENIVPVEQTQDVLPTYYSRRTPKDSEIDVEKTIFDQFNLIRTCDPNRFPAWFMYKGQKYRLMLEKFNDDEN